MTSSFFYSKRMMVYLLPAKKNCAATKTVELVQVCFNPPPLISSLPITPFIYISWSILRSPELAQFWAAGYDPPH